MMEQSEKDLIKKKARILWADKRTYANKLMLSGAAMLAFGFTFIFFGPFEMVAFGIKSFDFTYKDVFWLLFSAMSVVFICGTLLVSLLRGKIYNYVIAIIFSVTVAGYLQAGFLNGSVGALTGEAVEWSRMKLDMIISLSAWVGVFILVITVLYFHREIWKYMVIGVSSMLVVMQITPMVGILMGAFREARIPEGPQYYFTFDGLQEYSSDENIIVFILDYLDYDFIESIYKENPDFFDEFEGFTGYTDAVSVFGRTKPSICNILTGYDEGAYLVHNDEYMENAWNAQNPNLLDVLKENDFSIEMYASMNEIFSSGEFVENKVSNIATKDEVTVTVVPGIMLKKLMYLSAYRYAPTAIKPFFWEYTTYYNEGVCEITTVSSEDASGVSKEAYSSNNLTVCGLLAEATATRSEKSFKLIYIDGAHPPCYLNRYGEYTDAAVGEYEQSIGCLTLMKNVFSQMKELGIYEDATIILTADHGVAGKLWLDDFSGMKIGMFYKPSGSAEMPLVWSDNQVSTANIPATIVKAAGLDSEQFGLALDEVDGGMYERTFYRVNGYPNEEYFEKYKILGAAGDFSNWKLEGTHDVRYPFY